ncbi:MAG: selenoneine synthase SenA [Pseudomonadota bacterium]|nr:selenoneine synthase SenA [Pseudomonadota bacterium]
MTAQVSTDHLIEIMLSARQRTLELLDGLSSEQLVGPKLPILNPIIWEIGHVAWFHEFFILRQENGHRPLLERGDVLYDSIAVAHDTRWDLPVYPLREMKDYMACVLDTLTEQLHGGQASERESYLYQFTTFHEDMHDEAFTWARQTLAYPTPTFAPDAKRAQRIAETGALDGDANIPGGMFRLGSRPDDPFVFDNEKWAHDVTVEPFRMARAPVTCGQFVEFVEDGGYERDSLWTEDGLSWRRVRDPKHPVYWKRDTSGGWKVRLFDVWNDLASDKPVVHVNWHEANAFCTWAGRRLPTEAEWEFAATMRPSMDATLVKSNFPWGNSPITAAHANTDGFGLGCADVADYAMGDNAWGCRQLIGNIWEWTSDTFNPFDGFAPDDYKEYSEPLFGMAKVLRGGSWVTRSRYVNAKYRNYFGPERSDIFCGFRTCAVV